MEETIRTKQAGYKEMVLDILNRNCDYKWHLEELDILANVSDCLGDMDFVEKMIPTLKTACEVMDIRVKRKYFNIFKGAYENLPAPSDRLRAMQIYYQTYGPENLSGGDEDFVENLKKLISNRVTSSVEGKPQFAAEVADQLGWFLMLNLKNTLWQCFCLAVRNKDALGSIIAILRYLKPIAGVRESCGFPTLVVSLQQLVERGVVEIDQPGSETPANFVQLCATITRTPKRPLHIDSGIDLSPENSQTQQELKPLVHPNYVIRALVYPGLKQERYRDLFLQLLTKMVSHCSCRVDWLSDDTDQLQERQADETDNGQWQENGHKKVDAVCLMIAVGRLCSECLSANNSTSETRATLFKTLKTVSQEIGKRKLKLSKESVDFLDRKLSTVCWEVKFLCFDAIPVEFLAEAGKKPQLPTCFVNSLSAETRAAFQKIECFKRDHSPEYCQIATLFRLVTVGLADKAIWFLREGGFNLINREFLAEKVGCVLQGFLRNASKGFWEETLKIVTILDLERELPGRARISGPMLVSLGKVVPVLVLSDAVLNYCSQCPSQKSTDHVIGSFCVLMKEKLDKLEKEMSSEKKEDIEDYLPRSGAVAMQLYPAVQRLESLYRRMWNCSSDETPQNLQVMKKIVEQVMNEGKGKHV